MPKATTNDGVAAQDNNFEAVADYSEDDAAAVFLNRWNDEEPEDNESLSEESEEPKDDEEEETPEVEEEAAEEEAEETEETDEDPEEDSEEETEDADDEEESEETTEKKVLGDDALVKVKVGDQELEVSVKDLKRLYGQEAALTQKSQQVAEKRKAIEAESTKISASLERLYKKAEERWKPYAEIDMLVASKQLDTETFTALRKEAQEAYEDFRFITQEVDSFVAQTNQQRQVQQQEAAKEAVKTLKEKIPSWSPQLYDQIRDYAISVGMEAEVVNNVTNPVAIEMMHKARLYDESKKIATKKKVATPKKVIKSTSPVTRADVKTEKVTKTSNRLRSTGSVDDATDLFLSRWQSDE